jgi:methyl-accepting chemotaxis protein
MKNWKIGMRLAAGFGAVTLVAIMLGGVAYTQLISIDKAATRITVDALPGVSLIGQYQALSYKNFALLLQHVLATDTDEMDRLEGEISTGRASLSAQLAAYEKTISDPRDRELFAAIGTARVPYLECYSRVIKLSRGLKTKEAMALVEGQLKPLFDKLAAANEASVAFNKENGDDAGKSITHAVGSAKTGIVLGLLLALAIALGVSIVATRSIANPMQVVVAHLSSVARGDLSHDTESAIQERGDEIGTLGKALQSMIVALREMVKDIGNGVQVMSSSSAELSASSGQMTSGSRNASDKAHAVAAAAEEVSTNITSVAAGMEQTATNLDRVSAHTEQMTATIDEIAGNSEKARSITDEARRQAEKITTQMNQLGQAAKEIGKVTEAITEISAQTNLLALNATIEAARAGAAGKGFAVVANEIKELAQQTASATEDIKTRIADVQSSTAGGIAEIGKVSQVIHDVSDIVSSIAAAIEEQATVTKDIARNIAEATVGVKDANLRVSETSQATRDIAKEIVGVDEVAGQMASGSDNVRTSAGDLSRMAEQLQSMMSRFHL